MDFLKIKQKSLRSGQTEVYPDFKVCRSTDLMIRGKQFYAIYDESTGLWSTDEYMVQKLVDAELRKYKEEIDTRTNSNVSVRYLSDYSSKAWSEFKSYVNNLADNSTPLDTELTFLNTEVNKDSYASKRLNYELMKGETNAWDKLLSTLYKPTEVDKIEWVIGSIISGDSKEIQKFIVFYGEPGKGKSTIINIIQKLFEGYETTFDAKSLTSNGNAFATETFKNNPLVAFQHDGDLSKIEDNSKLNSIVSHEDMICNEKYKPTYTSKIISFLIMATNKPVRITDSKSGVIRRLLDVIPTGDTVSVDEYDVLMNQINFQLGHIAYHCLEKYKTMGRNFYKNYKPISMIMKTDIFYNFVEDNYFEFKDANDITLTRAYDVYKNYCDNTNLEYKLARHKFREQLKDYFEDFSDIARNSEGKQVRSYYKNFKSYKFKYSEEFDMTPDVEYKTNINTPKLIVQNSIIDDILKDCPAQYANSYETPTVEWDKNNSILSDIDTTKLHYVKPPINHIVIDFDIKNENGEKSLPLNIEASKKFPDTYMEVSKSGKGLHLHYIYDGDATNLKNIYDTDIEIKVFSGKASLRRCKTKCNNIAISHISNLPIKEKQMIDTFIIKNEATIRKLLDGNLHKEYHPGTKPSMDFIKKILDEAYNSGIAYDCSDYKNRILNFAMNSSHQKNICCDIYDELKFKSVHDKNEIYKYDKNEIVPEEELRFFDCEVYPNLFVIVYKKKGKGNPKIKLINPTSEEVERLFSLPLVGYNCRGYDNHILYARYLGYNLNQLYELSQTIIKGNSNDGTFLEAYNISYLDIYKMSSKRQSLKKFEIELGITHKEMEIPWDEPVPESLWDAVVDYCCNDVEATEAVFDDRQNDYVTRKILTQMSGLPMNLNTQKHAAKIIFGNDKNYKDEFVYTDLSKEFPGYKYEFGKSTYRGEIVGEGGYVYAEPGYYTNLALLDIESMHPNTMRYLNIFGKYTARAIEMLDARVAIKHDNLDLAATMLDGLLIPYLNDEVLVHGLNGALKTVINMLYGMTSAKFDNPFKDPRNIDNIVAKRGALFMIDLKYELQDRGYTVAHVKTDSVKIPNATPEVIAFVTEYGLKRGYKFEHEATYNKLCLINKSTYIAQDVYDNHWTATGSEFKHPYIFKTMFSNEPIEYEDLVETKSVKSKMYLDFNENMEDVSKQENIFKKDISKIKKEIESNGVLITKDDPIYINKVNEYKKEHSKDYEYVSTQHDYHFIGKVSAFVPIKPGLNGGVLCRQSNDTFDAVSGTKGFRWKEHNMCDPKDVDMEYYNGLIEQAKNKIEEYVDFHILKSEVCNIVHCGSQKYTDCLDCPYYGIQNNSMCKLGYYNDVPF